MGAVDPQARQGQQGGLSSALKLNSFTMHAGDLLHNRAISFVYRLDRWGITLTQLKNLYNIHQFVRAQQEKGMEVNDEEKTETQRTTDYVCRRVLLQTLDATPEIL